MVISGPTGAGKSILIGALALLLGRKADAGVIAPDAENCVVEGEFQSASPYLEAFARDNDFEYENGHFTVRRTVARSGRSRAFINDTPVTLDVLVEFGQSMVDIHSQHDTRLLTAKAYQLSILDAFAGNSQLLEKCASLYSGRRALEREISALKERLERMEKESDYNQAVYAQLCEAALCEGELEELEQEQAALANSEQIKELLASSAVLFDGDQQGSEGVNSALVQLHRNLDRLSQFLKGFDSLSQRLESARLELKDIYDEVDSANEALVASPERLQQVDDRLSLLYSLMKRHDASDIAGLIQKRDSLKNLVFGAEDLAMELEQARKEYSEICARYDEVAAELHSRRAESAASFASAIISNLAFMELDRAAFEVQLSPADASEHGTDEVAFLFNAAGGRCVPLAKCASGGELSRIMLALKQLMSEFMSMPVMVFDEIDTGVSGSVADKMGSVICQMGRHMQVFAITHLPQVAAKGQAHYLVEKSVGEGRATSTIKKLSDEQRVLEIARMLSGSSLTDAAIENARALLAL